MGLHTESAPHRPWLLGAAQRWLFLQLLEIPMPEKRPSLLTWLPRLCRDFRRDLLRNSFWGHSLQKVSNL